MKFLLYSDLHLDEPDDPINSRYDEFIATAHWIAELIKEQQPDCVVNLGDTNHRDGGMSVGTIQLFKDFHDIISAALSEAGIIQATLVGNHD